MTCSPGAFSAGIAALVATMTTEGSSDRVLFQDIADQIEEVWNSIDGQVLQMIASEASYAEGLTALAEAQQSCCESDANQRTLDRTFTEDVIYDGFPIEVRDAEGNVIGTQGPEAAWLSHNQAALAFENTKWTAFNDNVQIPWWVQMIAAAVATIQGIVLFNEFLGILNDIMGDNAELVGDARGAAVNTISPAIETHAVQWAEANADRIALLDENVIKHDARGDAVFDHWDATYRANEADWVAQSFELATTYRTLMEELTDAMTTAADDAVAFWEANYAGEGAFAAATIEQAQCSVERICEIRDWLMANAEKVEAFWDATYGANTTALVDASTTVGIEATTKVSEVYTALETMGNDRTTYYDGCYSGTECTLSQQVMNDAVTSSANLVVNWDNTLDHYEDRRTYWDTCYSTPECTLAGASIGDAATASAQQLANQDEVNAAAVERLAYFNANYATPEAALAAAVFSEATELVDKLSVELEWFEEHSEEMQDFWDGCYKDAECATVGTLIERANSMSDYSESIIEWVSEFAEEMKAYWDNCYQAAECTVAPVIIDNGDEASDGLEEEYEFFSERARDMWSYWNDNWFPCDVKDLEFHCEMWDKHNMLEEIHADKDLSRSLADATYEAYTEHGLPCQVERNDEICAMEPYEPQYCEVEGKALLHVRAQVDRAKEEAQRCNTRYCCGATQHTLNQLELQRAQLETGAMQAAHRYEYSRYISEENRRHRYHQDIFGINEQYPLTTDRSLNTSVEANHKILSHIHDRIVRGYEYLSNMQNAGRTAVQGMADAIRFAIETIRVGHTHLELSEKSKMDADRDSLQHIQFGLSAIELGHFFPRLSLQARELAEKTAVQASQLGLDSTRLGHFHPQMHQQLMSEAIRSSQVSESLGIDMARTGHTHQELAARLQATGVQAANASTGHGLTTIGLGHDHFQSATDNMRLSGTMADSAIGRAISALSQGPQYADLAARKAKDAMNGSINGGELGRSMVATGHYWQGLAQNYRGAAAGIAESASNRASNLIAQGLNYAQMAEQYNRAKMAALEGIIDRSMMHLQNAYNGFSSAVTSGAAAGTAGSLGGIKAASGITGSGLQTLGDAYGQYTSQNQSQTVTTQQNTGSLTGYTTSTFGGYSSAGSGTIAYGYNQGVPGSTAVGGGFIPG